MSTKHLIFLSIIKSIYTQHAHHLWSQRSLLFSKHTCWTAIHTCKYYEVYLCLTSWPAIRWCCDFGEANRFYNTTQLWISPLNSPHGHWKNGIVQCSHEWEWMERLLSDGYPRCTRPWDHHRGKNASHRFIQKESGKSTPMPTASAHSRRGKRRPVFCCRFNLSNDRNCLPIDLERCLLFGIHYLVPFLHERIDWSCSWCCFERFVTLHCKDIHWLSNGIWV